MPQPISSSLMSKYVPNAEDSQCFQLSKMKKCEVDVKKEECRGCSNKKKKPGIFAIIAKSLLGFPISLSHKNFTRLEQFR